MVRRYHTELTAIVRGQHVGGFLEVARMASGIDDGSTYTNGDGSTYDAVRPPGGYGGGHHGRAVCSMVWNQDGGVIINKWTLLLITAVYY